MGYGSPIRISGMATGMDTDTLIKQMMQAKRIPIDRMKQERTQLTWKRDAYRDMNLLMTQLRDAASGLRLQSSMMAKKATITDPATNVASNNVTATVASTALAGTYTLKVDQLATIARADSLGTVSATASMAASDTVIEIKGKDSATAKEVTITSGAKVTDVVSKINSVSGETGVKAVYDANTQKLQLLNASTGNQSLVSVNIKQGVGGDNNLLANLNLVSSTPTPAPTSLAVYGKNAKVYFDNDLANPVQYQTNTFTNRDITYTLVKDPALGGGPYTVSASVDVDVDKVYDKVKTFVDKYNEVIDKVTAKIREQKYRDYPPLSDEQKAGMKEQDIKLWEDKAKSGMLRNDEELKRAIGKFRDQLLNNVPELKAAGTLDTLYEIGIATKAASDSGNSTAYRENGKLYLDETKLRNAIQTNPEQVAELFTHSTSNSLDITYKGVDKYNGTGYGERIYQSVNTLISAFGKLAGNVTDLNDTSDLGDKIRKLGVSIEEKNSRLGDYEQKYYSQFARLEAAINKMHSQQQWLSSQFAGGQ